MTDVTQLLKRIDSGDCLASAELLPVVYDELRRLAAAQLAGESPGHTLQATALVHEAYLRLAGGASPDAWDHRGHFFGSAAEAMRRILVDHARKKNALKRGGGQARHDAEGLAINSPKPVEDLVALDEALTKLAAEEPEKARLVELRYFAGLTIDQAADALGFSPATAKRHWSYARAWLYRQLDGDPIEHENSENLAKE